MMHVYTFPMQIYTFFILNNKFLKNICSFAMKISALRSLFLCNFNFNLSV